MSKDPYKEIIKEFKNWQNEWEWYYRISRKRPIDVSDFPEYLKSKFEIKIKNE